MQTLKSAIILIAALLLILYGLEKMQSEALEISSKENVKWIATKH